MRTVILFSQLAFTEVMVLKIGPYVENIYTYLPGFLIQKKRILIEYLEK